MVDYNEYLESPEWAEKRRQRLAWAWDSDPYDQAPDPDSADDPCVSDDDGDRSRRYREGPRCEVYWEQGRRIRERIPNLHGIGDRCRHRATQVHHKTYERLGHERMEDLAACCRSCHRAIEKQLAQQKGANPDAR